MLKIRDEQAEALSAAAVDRFDRRALLHVRSELPDVVQGRSDQDLLDVIASTRRAAPRFSLTSERQIMCLVDSAVILGDQFWIRAHRSWALPVLRSKKLSANERAQLVLLLACKIKDQPAKH